MRGTISVSSRVGEGATFRISFPAVAPAEKSPEAKAEGAAQRRELRGRVLVVDDEEEIRVIVGKYLSRVGMSVDYAEDGAAALAKIGAAGRSPYDVGITDLKMNGMDGEEMIARARAMGVSQSKFILITGGTVDAHHVIARQVADEYLLKPFTREEICGAVERFALPTGTQ
jgi:DNA-binding response OmpR family regulator